MAVDINVAFSEFFILVGDRALPINAIGILKSEHREFIVLNDMDGLVAEDEYIIYELFRKNELKLVEIEDMEFYQQLCDLWELHLDGLEDSEFDS